MKSLKTSNTLKIICYCLIPILVLIIILNIVSIVWYSNYPEEFLNDGNYINSQQFSDNYLYNIQRAISIVKNEKEYIQDNTQIMLSDTQFQIEVENGEKVKTEEQKESGTEIIDKYRDENDTDISEIEYNFYTIKNYDILIITQEGDIITNVGRTTNTDTVSKIKDYILSKKFFWVYDLKNINTNIDKLQYNEIVYNGFSKIQKSNYEIYTALREENGEMHTYNALYSLTYNTYQYAFASIIISSTLLIICIVYIVISIGHKKGQDEIYTYGIDKIPYEIICTGAIILLAIEIFVLIIALKFIGNMANKFELDSGITISIFMGIVGYATLTTWAVTTIRRIKAHVFWKNTIIYNFCKFTLGGLFENFNKTIKLAMQYGGFIIISIILSMLIQEISIIGVLILLAFWYYVFKKMLNNTNQISKIRQKISKIYHGDIDEVLYEEEFTGELKQIAKELNDISGGLSNAIDEKMKSERLKTELITNVSHDIKTPLTSIINYVDLMKKEEIDNEKVQEYLQILDNKSQRLKKLTEDLVEASKASSGNIQLNIERLNVKELVKQVRGEFEEKFEKRGLEIIETLPEEEIYIEADSRYMYRVMENMYVNISKYALENSRVYVDIKKEKEKAIIELKNISQDKLNISVDELMQRFVRGDSARTTEGSGLGISIAKSLTELQKGKFDIYLDGDLFKVVIEFDTDN